VYASGPIVPVVGPGWGALLDFAVMSE
jgi:hypothetical protein